MRVIFNHITIGLIYKSFWRLVPAFTGSYISLFYQFINLYGLLPALLGLFLFMGLIVSLGTLFLTIISLFIIPPKFSILVMLLLIIISFLSWLLSNFKLNRQLKLKLFKLNYSSYTAFLLINSLFCRSNFSLPVLTNSIFLDVHFKPSLAGKLKQYSHKELSDLIRGDYDKLKLLNNNSVLFGITPGNLSDYLAKLEGVNSWISPTIIPPKSAKIFGLIRDFFLHVVIIKKTNH